MHRFLTVSIPPESPFYDWPEAAIQMILEGKSVKEAKAHATVAADAQIEQHQEAIAKLRAMKTALRDLQKPVIPDEAAPVSAEATKEPT